ncbi:hypothetical protein NDU88_005621 [Pleurodeles waltl]|uniref:Myb/SANT-like DNA-binding domain-containing protein n=1 Tax=Pleurodeles waltl TaxID=8319 RepID=A0AAV7NNA9_PLEWA|nr:hypothetical protein NDU88_005621 [Pleurodeles waltl]
MELWRRIVDRVNAVRQHPKTRDDIRKRWNDLRGKVSAHQKKGIWCAITKDCRKRWEDLRRWAQKTAEAQLVMASQRGRGAY